jgi:hypothetical protein
MATTTKTNLTLPFELEKETPGTYRYSETSDNPAIGKLYIKKTALQGGAPQSITVTVTS